MFFEMQEVHRCRNGGFLNVEAQYWLCMLDQIFGSSSCCTSLLAPSTRSFLFFVADNLLGFYNRTCGSQPPREVGPSLRASSITSWSQWVFTIIGDDDIEQWGYIETYYPQERGQAR